MDLCTTESNSPNGMNVAAPLNGGNVFRSTSMYSGEACNAVVASNRRTGGYTCAGGAVAVAPTAVSYMGSFVSADREVSQNILAQTFEEQSAGAVRHANSRPTTPPIGQPVGDMLVPLLVCAAMYALAKSIKSRVCKLRRN